MADVLKADSGDSSSMGTRRSLMFWIRAGGVVICLMTVVSDFGQRESVFVKPGQLALLQLCGTVLYCWLFLRNTPLQVNLNPDSQGSLLLQIVLGFTLNYDLWTLSLFSMPFAVPPRRRGRWFLAYVALYLPASWYAHFFLAPRNGKRTPVYRPRSLSF